MFLGYIRPLTDKPSMITTTHLALGNSSDDRPDIIIQIGYKKPAADPPHTNLTLMYLYSPSVESLCDHIKSLFLSVNDLVFILTH